MSPESRTMWTSHQEQIMHGGGPYHFIGIWKEQKHLKQKSDMFLFATCVFFLNFLIMWWQRWARKMRNGDRESS